MHPYRRFDWKTIAGAAGLVGAAGAVGWLFAEVTGLPAETAAWVLWVALGAVVFAFEFRRIRRADRLEEN